jgi:hypothetical protein
MRGVLGHAGPRAGLCALMAVLALSVTAQEKPEVKPILKLGGTSSLGDSALFMMVRTRPDLNEKEILGTLKRGLEKSGCRIDGEPIIRPIRPTIYEEFESPVNQTTGSSPEPDGALVPRLIPAREVLWEFRLKDPRQSLASFITWAAAGSRPMPG